MKKQALFVVNTPYQLMVVINMCRNEFRDFENHLVLTEQIKNKDSLKQNLSAVDVFSSVIDLPIGKICDQFDRIGAIRNSFFLPPMEELKSRKVDVLLFANLNYSITVMYRHLKKGNPHISLQMFEDGLSTYSEYYRDFFHGMGVLPAGNDKGSLRLFAKRIFHHIVDAAFLHIDALYVYRPQMLTYQPYFQVKKLKHIDANPQTLALYNTVFDAENALAEYDCRVIFFEESYYADGIACNDTEVVQMLAQSVGKDNIMIKIHPRNPVNRFQQMGYKTNRNTGIPWEIIAMNMNLSDKVLVTIASAAVIVPHLMFDKKYTGVLVMDALADKSFMKSNITNLYAEICRNTENLHLLHNLEELPQYVMCQR